jgi:hypothetical protein
MKTDQRSKIALLAGIFLGEGVLLVGFKAMGIDNDSLLIVLGGFLITIPALALLLVSRSAIK